MFFDSRARNVAQYPNPNRFSVTLPRPLDGVSSIRLTHAMLPTVSTGSEWLYGITISVYAARGLDVQRPVGDTNYPNALLGLVRTAQLGPPDSAPSAWTIYRETDNAGASRVDFPGRIPKLMGFELAVVRIDEVAGGSTVADAVWWDPADPVADMTVNYKNWCGSLTIESTAP